MQQVDRKMLYTWGYTSNLLVNVYLSVLSLLILHKSGDGVVRGGIGSIALLLTCAAPLPPLVPSPTRPASP